MDPTDPRNGCTSAREFPMPRFFTQLANGLRAGGLSYPKRRLLESWPEEDMIAIAEGGDALADGLVPCGDFSVIPGFVV
jgi:hypothetical protein